MATPGRTQKQIAERYKGNLGYYKRKHPWRVARWCASFLAIVGGIIGIALFPKRGNEEFFSSGKISSNHAAFEQDCAQCHDKGAPPGGPNTLAKFQSVVNERFHRGLDFTSIDHNCQDCHEGKPPFKPRPAFMVPKDYKLHEPNVVKDRSCSVCHEEHLGPGRMKKVADLQCASCHSDRGIMEASAQYGMELPPARFHLRPHPPQQVVFEMPRPPRGYTQVISSFAGDHPEFQLVREKARDLNTDEALRFNHQRHFATDIPPVAKDQKLDCNYCHKPDPAGRFYQRINFVANCQVCHALLFDKNNPQLHIPHGNVKLVRNFLRTLPAQYGDYAKLDKGKIRDVDVQTFVADQIRKLRQQFGSGEELEKAVFTEKDPYKPQRDAAAATKAQFAGCAHCHDVKMPANSAPVIAPPTLVDRWMPQANFNHAKHTSVNCEECHDQARGSSKTSDVLMPNKAKCVACHSPETKRIASDCITCHTYHAPGQVVKVEVRADSRESSFKQMLLGSNLR
jgi:Cytochrome c3/Cytochrome c7 and related cytochrome c